MLYGTRIERRVLVCEWHRTRNISFFCIEHSVNMFIHRTQSVSMLTASNTHC